MLRDGWVYSHCTRSRRAERVRFPAHYVLYSAGQLWWPIYTLPLGAGVAGLCSFEGRRLGNSFDDRYSQSVQCAAAALSGMCWLLMFWLY